MYFYEEEEIQQNSIEELRNKLAELKNRIKIFAGDRESQEKLGLDMLAIEKRLVELKTFKKDTCIQNIRDLLKKTPNVKISQIETEANCSIGYLSRLDKEDSSTDPSIEFIATAARMLGVTVDFLMYGKVEELTPTESFIVEFLDSLIKDTENDEMVWKVDEAPEEFIETDPDLVSYEIVHPLYSFVSAGGGKYSTYYKSEFESYAHLTSGFDSYVGTLPNSTDKVYVMCCTSSIDEMTEKPETFVECYLDTDNGISPLCTSHNVCSTMHAKVLDLYKAISKSGKRIHISSDAMASINRYLKNRNSIPDSF